MTSLAIIGFGRFGQLLAQLMREDFHVSVIEKNPALRQEVAAQGYQLLDLEEAHSVDTIILAVPISALEETIRSLAEVAREDQLVLDICSVKVHPARLMKKYLSKCRLLATHPMFGPDSAKNGLAGLSVALCPLTAKDEDVAAWEAFWQTKGVSTIRTTPEQHDKDAVYSQAFSYMLAKFIRDMNIPQLTFSTASYDRLKEVGDLSAQDSEQLFHDMLFYNPYFKDMAQKLKLNMANLSTLVDEIVEKQEKT